MRIFNFVELMVRLAVPFHHQHAQRTFNSPKTKYTSTLHLTSRQLVNWGMLFCRHEVLKEKTRIDDGIGFPEWRLTLCLFVSWAFTFLVSIKGVQSSGKASYFLAIFPYVVMITLLIRAVTLEGAWNGIMYFIRPEWSKLLSANVSRILKITYGAHLEKIGEYYG